MTAFRLATPNPGGADAAPVMATHDTPVGRLTLVVGDRGLRGCSFAPPEKVRARQGFDQTGPAAERGRWLELTRWELDSYFAGRLREFTVPVDLGTTAAHDRRVLHGLAGVEFGTTTTYGRLAERLGLPREAARSVGRAMALNPVLVVVPCHRVVGASGALTGYAGGLTTKRRLLELERPEHAARQLCLEL
jgi:methylated-DNA-[protein]-cysteine S-methyltransferase